MDKNKEILRTYGSMWNYEVKIYSIEKIRLPVPINPSAMVYFIIGVLIMIFIGKLVPAFTAIPSVLRILLFPYFLTQFLRKKKLDGKLPHKFMLAYIGYMLQPKCIARFKAEAKYGKGYFATPVSYRRSKLVNITEMMLNRKGGLKHGGI